MNSPPYGGEQIQLHQQQPHNSHNEWTDKRGPVRVPGAGKTRALKACNRIWEGEGYSVVGATTSWQAADVLTAEAGIRSQSIASLRYQIRDWESRGVEMLDQKTVLVIDEAGMVSTTELVDLLRFADRAGSKVVLIGDYDQLQAVGPGGLFRSLYERYGIAHMPHSIRQKNEIDWEIIRLIGRGQGAAALELLRTEENVVVAKTGEERDQALVNDWWKSFSQGKDCLMLAETNRAVDDLNYLARELMKQDGQLGKSAIQLPDGRRFAEGDRVVTRKNDHGLGVRNLQRWDVTEVDSKTKSLTLASVETEGESRQVTVGPAYLSETNDRDQPALQHGYAVTGHVAQGATHAEVFAQAGTYQQWMHTALSRATDSMKLYAVVGGETLDAETGPTGWELGYQELGQAMSRDQAELTATDQIIKTRLEGLSERRLVERLQQINTANQQHKRRDALKRAANQSRQLVKERKDKLEQAPDQLKPLLRQELEAAASEHREIISQLEKSHDPLATADLAAERAAEKAMIDRELTRQRQARLTAARLKPPVYIEKELGPMPNEGRAAALWIKTVDRIEEHRQKYAITDQQLALGHESKNPERKQDARQVTETIRSARTQIEKTTEIELAPSTALTLERDGFGIEM